MVFGSKKNKSSYNLQWEKKTYRKLTFPESSVTAHILLFLIELAVSS